MRDSGIQFGAVMIRLCKCIAPRNKQLYNELYAKGTKLGCKISIEKE